MQTINLKQYYPFCKEDIFVEVSDEIVEAFLLDKRAEAARDRKMFRYKAFYSLDCNDGIENAAIGWAQPSPEDHLIEKEELAEYEELIAPFDIKELRDLLETDEMELDTIYNEGGKRGLIENVNAALPYSLSNAIRTLAMVRATGLEPARFWQWNLNPPSLPIPPCPLISAGCAAVCFPSGLPGYLNTNISHCQSDSFFFFRSLFCQFCPEKTACMGFYTVYLPFYP